MQPSLVGAEPLASRTAYKWRDVKLVQAVNSLIMRIIDLKTCCCSNKLVNVSCLTESAAGCVLWVIGLLRHLPET